MYWFFLVQVYDEDLEKLESHFRFYYDCLMRPNARSVHTVVYCFGKSSEESASVVMYLYVAL